MLIGGAEGLGGAVGLLDVQETQAGDRMNLHGRHLTLLQRAGRIVLIPRQDQVAGLDVFDVLGGVVAGGVDAGGDLGKAATERYKRKHGELVNVG